MYIDTHSHLTDEAFAGEVEEVILRAKSSGVGLIINIGYDMKSSQESAQIAQKHHEVYFCAGLHPDDGDEVTDENLAVIRQLALSPKCVAIGEIGLDYHYDGDREQQLIGFKKQLDLAVELNMPVSIHARDCTADMLSVLSEYAGKLPSVVLHCYSMGAESAKVFVKLGCYFAFGGVITFKNNKQIYEVAKVVPIDRLLTETDCPYMAPVPYRGKTNEPAYVPYVCGKLAELYGVTDEEMQTRLLQNTLRAFPRIKL